MESRLDIEFDENNILQNDPRPYIKYYSREQRLNNFYRLFHTLKVFHESKIILGDIRPHNIMTNVNLKKVNDKNKPAINLFFIDFDLSNIDENGV